MPTSKARNFPRTVALAPSTLEYRDLTELAKTTHVVEPFVYVADPDLDDWATYFDAIAQHAHGPRS